MEVLWLVPLGFLAAMLGALVGLGGGFIVMPMLAMIYIMPASDVIGTSMAVLLVTALSSSIAYLKQRKIDIKSGLWFATAMIPGSYIGAWMTTQLDSKILYILFGCFLLMMAATLIRKPKTKRQLPFQPTAFRVWTDDQGQKIEYAFPMHIALAIAFGVGFISSLFGIGGGSVMVPAMVLLFSFPAHVATATSMFSIFFAAIVGTVSHASFGHIHWEMVLWLALGALIGGQVGPAIAKKVSGPWVMRILAICLVLIALRLLISQFV